MSVKIKIKMCETCGAAVTSANGYICLKCGEQQRVPLSPSPPPIPTQRPPQLPSATPQFQSTTYNQSGFYNQLSANEYRVAGETEALTFTLVVAAIIGLVLVGVTLGFFILVIAGFAIGLASIKMMQGHMLGSAIKVGQKQFPELHRATLESTKSLCMHAPAVYVKHDPTINASAFGAIGQMNVLLHSATVEQLTEEELKFIIGHELSHIKCGHTLWLLIVNSSMFSWWSVPLFMHWSRKAEYTCDRGGLLVCGDIAHAVTALTKMTIGKELFSRLNLQEFLGQGDLARGDLSAQLGELGLTHPHTVHRIQHLIEFHNSDLFRQLRARIAQQ